jgi:hypothetical protein
MENIYQKAKEYVRDHKKQFSIGVPIVVVLLIGLLIGSLWSYNHQQPKIVYEPASACDLLTLAEAKTLLGTYTINPVNNTPVQSGNVTTSQCAYSDGLADTSHAIAVEINVRSAINDDGIKMNKAQFEAGKPTGAQDVTGIGDEAYFNPGLGQLNVLKETTWIIMSYGAAANPQGNTLADAEKLAKLILNAQ